MSYILEALKKSDQKHQLGTVPGLHTVHAPQATAGGRRVWLYLLLVLLAGNAGALGWWLWPGRVTGPVVVRPAANPPVAAVAAPVTEVAVPLPRRMAAAPEPVPPVVRVEVARPETVAAAPLPELMAARQEVILARQEALMARQETVQTRQNAGGAAAARVVPAQEQAGASEPLSADPPESVVAEEAAAEEVAPAAKAQLKKPLGVNDGDPLSMGLVAIEEGRGNSRPSAARPGRVSKESGAPEEHLPSLASLPEALRADIPPLLISFHSYSTTASASLARINGKIMREGDFLQPGLKLERITPTGVVISVKGERFQVTMS